MCKGAFGGANPLFLNYIENACRGGSPARYKLIKSKMKQTTCYLSGKISGLEKIRLRNYF